MKKLIHLIYIIPVLLLAACSQEEAPLPSGNKTVQINLSTRVGNTDAGTNDENAIHSIRVYAFDATSNELVGYHHEASIDATKSYIFQMPLNFSLKEDFTSGSVQAKFYIVVNEEAVTLNNTLPEVDLEEGIPVNPNATNPSALNNILIENYGIKTDVPSEGLPMSSREEVSLNTETGQVLSFDLYRAVSRIKVQFKNENNSQPINITTLKFGEFIADKAYLFPKEEVPSDVSYTSNDKVSVSISAPFQEISDVVSCYILPSKAGAGKYEFGFNTDMQNYEMQKLQANENGAYSEITELPRNTSLDITATIKGDYIIFDIPNVNQWSEATGGIIIVD